MYTACGRCLTHSIPEKPSTNQRTKYIQNKDKHFSHKLNSYLRNIKNIHNLKCQVKLQMIPLIND
jgi:heterodisulfide reductase subunit B